MKIFVIPVIPDSYSIILTYNLTIDISRPRKVNKSWKINLWNLYVLLFCIFYLYIQIKIFPNNLFFYKNKSINQVKVKESNWSMYCTASNISESHRWRSLNVLPSHWRPDPSAVPCCPLPVNTQHYYSITTARSTALADIYPLKRTKTVLEQILRHKYLLNIHWINTNETICAFEDNARLYCIKGRRHRKVQLRCGLHRFTWNYT